MLVCAKEMGGECMEVGRTKVGSQASVKKE